MIDKHIPCFTDIAIQWRGSKNQGHKTKRNIKQLKILYIRIVKPLNGNRSLHVKPNKRDEIKRVKENKSEQTIKTAKYN